MTITALSGGNMIAGDRLDELDLARLGMVKKVFPAFGVAARPLDLFETELKRPRSSRMKCASHSPIGGSSDALTAATSP